MTRLFILFLLIGNISFGQTVRTPSYSKETVYAVNPKDTAQKILSNIYIQDSCGNETSFIEYNFIDYLSFETQTESASKVKDKGFREYIYKTKCKPVIVRVLDKEKKLIKRFLYSYNSNDAVNQLTIVDSKDNQISRYKYEYDKKNRLVKEVRFDSKNISEYVTIYKYDKDTISKEIRIDKRDNDTLICNYSYNSRRQLIVEEWSDMAGRNKEFEFSTYNNLNKTREFFLNPEDNISREYKMTYYNNGLLRTWVQVDVITGEILKYQLSEYELN